MKKGFMHIVEVLLVIVLVFFVFTQFSTIPSISGEWPRTKLSVLAGDAIKTLEAKGVDWFNGTQIENALRPNPGDPAQNVLQPNMIYSVRLQNVIKPRIKIGCLCSDGEFARIKSFLLPGWFMINGVNTSFDIAQVKNMNEAFSLDYDVTLISGYANLGPAQYAVRNFLGYDKGVVEMFDAMGQDPSDVQKSIFGLAAATAKSDGAGIIFSVASSQSGMEANKVYEAFINIPAFSDTFQRFDQWFGSAGVIDQSLGRPAPSLRLDSSGCNGEDYVFTRYYNTFRNGDIDFDVYLAEGASLMVGFGRSSASEYLASLSANASLGYDSFYQRQPLRPTGTNTSHLTETGKWSHVKIISKMGELTLYSNGRKVASAQSSGLLSSNITLYSRCEDARVDNLRITFTEKSEFPNFLNSENITQASDNPNKILLVQKGTNLPACVINYNVENIGKGRTAWISNATASEEYKNLLKAVLVWAAGSEYSPVKADLKSPVSAFFYKSLGNEMQQNAKIMLEIDYLY
jgi:hypothetical protein